MHMWYWAIMVLLILGSIALLCSTFISVKKNKAQDAERRKQSRKGKRNKADQGYDPEEDQPQGKKRRSSGQNGSMDSAKRSSKKRRQWKIILEDLDTWQKYSFIFYDEVGIGRAKRNDNYEKYLPLHEDGSKNGTYLNGILVDRPTEVQREDVIGVGETRLEILRILRESE